MKNEFNTKKIRLAAIAATGLMMIGCAQLSSNQNVKSNQENKSKDAPTVSANLYPNDPVGYATALMKAEGKLIKPGTYDWTTFDMKHMVINKAMSDWCKANGAKAVSERFYHECTTPDGQIKAKYEIAHQYEKAFLTVLDSEAAKKAIEERIKRVEQHKKTISTTGVNGKLTLRDGRSFELLRFGTDDKVMDYTIGNKKESVSIITARSITLNKNSSYDVVFDDGKKATSEYFIYNQYRVLNESKFSPFNWKEIDFGGIANTKMAMVIRGKGDAKPRLALINTQDIKSIKIDAIINKPPQRIELLTSDPKLKQALISKWNSQAAKEDSAPYDVFHNKAKWCDRIQYHTIEVQLACAAFQYEHEIASRSGVLTPKTTPAMLSDEDLYSLNNRSLI